MTNLDIQGAEGQTTTIEADEFTSLLNKEFRPKSDRAKEEVERAVRTLAEQALSSSNVISTDVVHRSEEHTSELQSLMRISYAVFCLKKQKIPLHTQQNNNNANNVTSQR